MIIGLNNTNNISEYSEPVKFKNLKTVIDKNGKWETEINDKIKKHDERS